jgi:hypothetical protein
MLLDPQVNANALTWCVRWAIRDRVPTLYHELKELVRARKAYDTGRLTRPEDSQPVRHKQVRRLSEAQIEDMAAQYRKGLTVYELAEVFGIARQTVGIILRRHGVETCRGIPKADWSELIRLGDFQSGALQDPAHGCHF